MSQWIASRFANGHHVELSFDGCKLCLDAAGPIHVATMGFGFLEKEILYNKSRYPCESDVLRREVESFLLPPKGRAKSFSNPKPLKLKAITQTLALASKPRFSGVAVLHVMRRLTTSRYNYDEFLGDRHSKYTQGPNLGEQLESLGLDYRYVPLAVAGPPQEILDRFKQPDYGWASFKDDYGDYLTGDVLAETSAWILRAMRLELLPVLLCCEPFVSCFDQLTPVEKREYGCHRFLLVKAIAQSVTEAGLCMQVVHLNPSEVRRAMIGESNLKPAS